jgi:hypothetical protein
LEVGCCDTGFTPQSKPAELILACYYEGYIYLPVILKD